MYVYIISISICIYICVCPCLCLREGQRKHVSRYYFSSLVCVWRIILYVCCCDREQEIPTEDFNFCAHIRIVCDSLNMNRWHHTHIKRLICTGPVLEVFSEYSFDRGLQIRLRPRRDIEVFSEYSFYLIKSKIKIKIGSQICASTTTETINSTGPREGKDSTQLVTVPNSAAHAARYRIKANT